MLAGFSRRCDMKFVFPAGHPVTQNIVAPRRNTAPQVPEGFGFSHVSPWHLWLVLACPLCKNYESAQLPALFQAVFSLGVKLPFDQLPSYKRGSLSLLAQNRFVSRLLGFSV